MSTLHNKHFLKESDTYRTARNTLLEAEIALRKQTEEVAKLRRHLPLGGKLQQEYVFTNKHGENVTFSQLFHDDKKTLVVYNMMFDPEEDQPCNMCNSIVDGLNGNARQITQRVNLVIVGKAPIEKLHAFAEKSGWTHINIVSSFGNTYNGDYFGEVDGGQQPMINVFIKQKEEIYHTWGSELALIPPEAGQDPRAIDTIWPLWNVLDLTSEGRGENWYPEIKI